MRPEEGVKALRISNNLTIREKRVTSLLWLNSICKTNAQSKLRPDTAPKNESPLSAFYLTYLASERLCGISRLTSSRLQIEFPMQTYRNRAKQTSLAKATFTPDHKERKEMKGGSYNSSFYFCHLLVRCEKKVYPQHHTPNARPVQQTFALAPRTPHVNLPPTPPSNTPITLASTCTSSPPHPRQTPHTLSY